MHLPLYEIRPSTGHRASLRMPSVFCAVEFPFGAGLSKAALAFEGCGSVVSPAIEVAF